MKPKPILVMNDLSAAGPHRIVMHEGRRHVVCPVTMIVPGVLHGSQGQLLYPRNEIEKTAKDWNGVPLTHNHPRNVFGKNISAKNPANRQTIGVVKNARTQDGKLKAEAWIDEQKANKLDPSIISNIKRGQTVEISTGLFVDQEPAAPGSTFFNTPYSAIAKNFKPDHLAVLTEQRGACPREAGCGLNVNQASTNPQPKERTEMRRRIVTNDGPDTDAEDMMRICGRTTQIIVNERNEAEMRRYTSPIANDGPVDLPKGGKAAKDGRQVARLRRQTMDEFSQRDHFEESSQVDSDERDIEDMKPKPIDWKELSIRWRT